jgi:pimeloyl-ACP methyl ester carboxylesterase
MAHKTVSKNIYIFSGLGADERVFQKLDFTGYSVNFIKWEIPLEHESIESYATRLTTQITASRPSLIGLSFGGLISIEIAKQIETEHVILIASAKNRHEIPWYYRWSGKSGFHKHLPTQLLKGKNVLSDLVYKGNSEDDKQILQAIFAGTNTTFLKWAIDQVVHWQNEAKLENITHIHGSADPIFPLRYVSCNIKINEGGHMLTLKNPVEISEILRRIL